MAISLLNRIKSFSGVEGPFKKYKQILTTFKFSDNDRVYGTVWGQYISDVRIVSDTNEPQPMACSDYFFDKCADLDINTLLFQTRNGEAESLKDILDNLSDIVPGLQNRSYWNGVHKTAIFSQQAHFSLPNTEVTFDINSYTSMSSEASKGTKRLILHVLRTCDGQFTGYYIPTDSFGFVKFGFRGDDGKVHYLRIELEDNEEQIITYTKLKKELQSDKPRTTSERRMMQSLVKKIEMSNGIYHIQVPLEMTNVPEEFVTRSRGCVQQSMGFSFQSKGIGFDESYCYESDDDVYRSISQGPPDEDIYQKQRGCSFSGESFVKRSKTYVSSLAKYLLGKEITNFDLDRMERLMCEAKLIPSNDAPVRVTKIHWFAIGNDCVRTTKTSTEGGQVFGNVMTEELSNEFFENVFKTINLDNERILGELPVVGSLMCNELDCQKISHPAYKILSSCKHGFKKMTSTSGKHTTLCCDHCENSFDISNDHVYGCRTCDKYLCKMCYSDANVSKDSLYKSSTVTDSGVTTESGSTVGGEKEELKTDDSMDQTSSDNSFTFESQPGATVSDEVIVLSPEPGSTQNTKNEYTVPVSQWACNICTYLNEKIGTHCEICEYPSPKVIAVAQS